MDMQEFFAGLLEKCKNPADGVYVIQAPLSILETQFIEKIESLDNFQNIPVAKWFFLNKKLIIDYREEWETQYYVFDDIPASEFNGEKDRLDDVFHTINFMLDAIERYSYLENYTL